MTTISHYKVNFDLSSMNYYGVYVRIFNTHPSRILYTAAVIGFFTPTLLAVVSFKKSWTNRYTVYFVLISTVKKNWRWGPMHKQLKHR